MNALATFGTLLLIATSPVAEMTTNGDLVFVQAADCYAIGEEQAAAQGGDLATATDAVQNGQPVCRVIVLVPGQNGTRPRRVEIIVPKG